MFVRKAHEKSTMLTQLESTIMPFLNQHGTTLTTAGIVGICVYVITTVLPRQLRKIRRMRSRMATALLASAIAGSGAGGLAGNMIDNRQAQTCPPGTIAVTQAGEFSLKSQVYCAKNTNLTPAPKPAPKPAQAPNSAPAPNRQPLDFQSLRSFVPDLF